MKLLEEVEIEKKIKRLAYEIAENNYEEEELVLAGINNRGLALAVRLQRHLKALQRMPTRLVHLTLSPADPLGQPITLSESVEGMQQKAVLIVDDVANTGRTLFYACKPFMEVVPRKVEIAVLVDRKHKGFPIRVDYVGLSLATTLQENISVNILEGEEMAVFLD